MSPENLEPIRKTVFVACPVETAFATFTSGVSAWWPVATHSLNGAKVAEVVFEERAGGRLYERSVDGEEGDWADVEAWEPPRRVVLRWRVNPKRGPTRVEVTFTGEGDGTRIELVHSGWDQVGDAAGRSDYDGGWDLVLRPFAERLSG